MIIYKTWEKMKQGQKLDVLEIKDSTIRNIYIDEGFIHIITQSEHYTIPKNEIMYILPDSNDKINKVATPFFNKR